MSKQDYPLIVIGAGAAGLVVAIGAAKAGKKVLLIERGNYGGDCTNFGCIPSKSFISSSHIAHAIKHSSRWGVELNGELGDTSSVFKRTQAIVEGFVAEEGPDALLKHGVTTITGFASFLDSHTLDVLQGDGTSRHITGDQIVIATGSRPAIPPIPGLETVPYLTNETVFELDSIPKSIGIIGGGAIGCELAQSFQRLGSRVTIIEFLDHLVFREEPESRELITKTLSSEGITLQLAHSAERVSQEEDGICVLVQDKSTKTQESLIFDHLLFSVGRRPNIDKLKLDAAGIEIKRNGICVDKYGRTSVKNIWVIGDAKGGPQFTHWAEAEARSVLTSFLLPSFLKSKLPTQPLPMVTFTDPEMARIGLTEEEAVSKYGKRKIAVYKVPFSSIDRAVTAGRTDGFIKVITRKWSSKILGATIVGERAGEMLPEIGLAMYQGIPLRKLANLIHPYPVYNQGIRKAADLYLSQTIFPVLKKILRR